MEKMILKSPLHGLLSKDLAVVSFSDPRTGKHLSFSVEYQKEKRFIRIICSRLETCWNKFIFGSPVEILIHGVAYHGWAELIEDPDETLKEWKAIFKHKPKLAIDFGIKGSDSDNFEFLELPETLNDYSILRIDISSSI
ncbi:MAG: hypothetical protein FJZ98_00680 [Chloroflexi bacterium]|nr:hypothetical protein [Chloroflexota bacterium]